MKLNYKKQDIAHAIEKKLKASPRSKNEKNVWYMLDGKKILRITYPHGSGDIPKGTANSIINQLKLNKVQFRDFINCPMKEEEYEKLIRDKGIV